MTKSGETPFDITEDPDIKDRLVELAEQRLRLAEPRVKRNRSSSTRTHSIRRTSLRDKMKTTKKDVAEEGLIFKASVNKPPSSPRGAADESGDEMRHSEDIVDVGDVQVTLPSTAYNPSKPVQYVPPQPKHISAAAGVPSPPARPSRSDKKSEHDQQHSPNIVASVLPQGGGSVGGGTTTAWSNNPGNEPINIHVSVTINPGMVTGGGGQNNNFSTGTLADLKRSRSQIRASTAGSNSSSTLSLNSAGAASDGGDVTMKPMMMAPEPSRARNLGEPRGDAAMITAARAGSPNAAGRKKFAASSVEVVGPPGKRGCCKIM